MITGHGDDSYLYNMELKADFSSNVWYEGPSEKLIRYLQDQFHRIKHYPEPVAESLTQQIAKKHRLDPVQVLVTNGSIEAFYLIAQSFAGQQSTILIPGFAEYEDACSLYNHTITFPDVNKDWQNKLNEANLVWIGNPNNPDGRLFAKIDLENLLYQYPTSIFVIDEAFCHLSYAHESVEALLKDYENLIIVRSFTKAFAIPGIRLGYMLSSGNLIRKINQYVIPWSVNKLAQQSGHFILDHQYDLLPDLKRLEIETIQFQENLQQIDEIEVIPSTCNFCLAKLKKGNAMDLKSYLVTQHGILIRNASNFRGLDSRYVRFALQRPEDNKLLIAAINQYFGNQQ